MADVHLQITTDERSYLVRQLETLLNQKRVEEHHTDRRAFRDEITHEIAGVEALLAKLRAAT